MSTPVPAAMREPLLAQMTKAHAAAYAVLDRDGIVISADGDLERMGAGDLLPGRDVCEVLPIAYGLIPSKDGATVIHRVHVTGQVVADLYLVEVPDGWGLALLDVTADERREAEMAQRVNDVALLRGRLARLFGSLQRDPGSFPMDSVLPEEDARARIAVLVARPLWKGGVLAVSPIAGAIESLAECAARVTAWSQARGAIVDVLMDGTIVAVFGLVPESRSPLAFALEVAREIVVERRNNPNEPDLALAVTAGDGIVGGRTSRGRHVMSVLGPCMLRAVRLADESAPGKVLLDERAAEDVDLAQLGGGRMTPVTTGTDAAVELEDIA